MKFIVLPWWVSLILGICALVFLGYLLMPNPGFPEPIVNSPRSLERGDSEDLRTRRAYFTDFNRQEVLTHYTQQWKYLLYWPWKFKLPSPVYRVNHRPEDAHTAIRDQTRSTFLEEIIHPFRESFYVNGFLPSSAKDTIIIEDRQFVQKITVRFVQSSLYVRLIIGFGSILLILILFNEWYRTVRYPTKI